MAAKRTRTEDGQLVVISTKRGFPDRCSPTCNGVYKFQGERMCKYFDCYADKRDKECIKNEIKGVDVWIRT